MKYSYGRVDRKNILLYKPQLFQKTDDLLIFQSRDFQIWHGDIKEYVDGLYQINSKNMENSKSINLMELDLAVAVLGNIDHELEGLFDSKDTLDPVYHYVSTLDAKYNKRRGFWYTKDMMKCDMRFRVKPEVSPRLKYHNMMEIIDQVTSEIETAGKKKQNTFKKLIKTKK